MSSGTGDKFSAGPQGLGYIYQPRMALLKLLEESERTGVLIEGQDDLEFILEGGSRSLASLKHRAHGNRLTDLSTDFWKSARIWLERYAATGKSASHLRFFLFTTGEVAENSFLKQYLQDADSMKEGNAQSFEIALSESSAKIVAEVESRYLDLNEEERTDFLDRVTIFDSSPRITEIPDLLSDRLLRTVRREHRQSVMERLEGWWNDVAIRQIAGERTDPIYGAEVSDKLSAIAEEYRSDNLPITFVGKQPAGIDPDTDQRLFVKQLRLLGTSADRIQSAIIDYYRAFEQRSSWAREDLLIPGEMEEYENRLVEEWKRYKAFVVESLGAEDSEEKLLAAGREVFRWAEFETSNLRIRERVTEPYVVRGAFHILANNRPRPRVHWHPKFLERVEEVLEGGS